VLHEYESIGRKIKMASEEDIKRIRELLEFLAKREVSKDLESLDKKEKEIYELTGVLGQTQIKDKLNVAPNTISDTWKKLENQGILRKKGKGYEKVF